MKNVLLFLVVSFFISIHSDAQSQGAFSGTNFANVTIPGSNQSWINMNNAGATDNQYATFGNLTGGAGSYTDYIVVSNFGFSIPANATISGIVVQVFRTDPNFVTVDNSIKIVKGGTVGGTEKSTGSPYNGGALPGKTFGSSLDLWGQSWTAADINSSNFGIAMSAKRAVASGTSAGGIDNVKITVYYFITLPVTLIDFSLRKTGSTIELSWSTADETNVDHFEIERSANGTDFVNIGTIASKSQISNSNDYSFDDINSITGVSWYRIKIVSNNGGMLNSKIITTKFTAENRIIIYPSPWKKGTHLFITNSGNQRLTVHFFNSTGQLNATVSTDSHSIPVEGLGAAKGIIFYKIVDAKNIVKATGTLMVN